MKKRLDFSYYPVWKDLLYNEKIHYHPSGYIAEHLLNDEDIETLEELLAPSKGNINDPDFSQPHELYRKTENKDGTVDIILNNGFHKVFVNNSSVNTLSPNNEIVPLPNEANRMWILNHVIFDNDN